MIDMRLRIMRMRMIDMRMRISCLYAWCAVMNKDPWYHYLSSSRHASSSLSSWSSYRRRSSRHPTHLHVSAGSSSVPHPHRRSVTEAELYQMSCHLPPLQHTNRRL
jgi:hypothetical protein